MKDLSEGADALYDAMGGLYEGAKALPEGANAITVGVKAAYDGSKDLSEGARSAYSGAEYSETRVLTQDTILSSLLWSFIRHTQITTA